MKPRRYSSARVNGGTTGKALCAELRRSVAGRKILLAQYREACVRRKSAAKALSALLSREDFVALLHAEGIRSIPAPVARLLWQVEPHAEEQA
jgi:hypothetical protein